jgi:transcriptional regulator with XRE-family HTH domain
MLHRVYKYIEYGGGISMDIGSNLKLLREAAGLTQKLLAEVVGVSQPAIAQIESGVTRNPTLDVVLALADALGVTVDDLMRPGDDASPELEIAQTPGA